MEYLFDTVKAAARLEWVQSALAVFEMLISGMRCERSGS